MDHSEPAEASPDGSKVSRACDSCRTRKIRCDRASPCSNCVASKIDCHTTIQTNKPARQRVHISDEYEKKIDRIEERLSSIESVLGALVSKLDNLNINSKAASPSKHTKVTHSPLPRETTEPENGFEGPTTLNSHSELATNILERAVVSTPSMEKNPELRAALANLQSIVGRQSLHMAVDLTASLTLPTANSTIQHERPPWEMVEAVLTQATDTPTLTFGLIFPFLHRQDFKNIFVEVYESTDVPLGRSIVVHALLYNLFQEFAISPPKGIEKRMEYLKYVPHCRQRLEAAIGQLSLFITANYENILALLLAATYAVEISRPSLCWSLIQAAACLCISVGYHRYSTMKDDTKDEKYAKMHIFWFIYILDKSLSLRLGRPSTIQDWDISLPDDFLEMSPYDPFPAGIGLQKYWIQIAKIQGQTYEQLFSPAAFQKSATERSRSANGLITALNDSLESRSRIIPEISERYGDMADLFYYADVVIHYSIMTLVQRALCPDDGTFNPECIESARAALIAHQQCSSKYNIVGMEDVWTGYLHWSIMQTPFIPFMVIFCNAIAPSSVSSTNSSRSDLQSLSSFVASLQPCRTLSEGADKLYKLCNMFLQVAKLYVEAKEKDLLKNNHNLHPGMSTSTDAFYGTDNHALDFSALEQFDPYLSALGLAPGSAWPIAGVPGELSGTDMNSSATANEAIGNADEGWPNSVTSGSFPMGYEGENQLQNWFSGSRYIMGLMEEDVAML